MAELLREVEQFVYREARLADEGRYEEWEALWTDDGVYWVPAGDEKIDPERQMSIIFDNRARIATRVKQLGTGRRHAQRPPSRLRRLISNIELRESGRELGVEANFVVFESREPELRMWAGRTRYALRRASGGLKMARKTVLLVNSDRPLPTLAFLI